MPKRGSPSPPKKDRSGYARFSDPNQPKAEIYRTPEERAEVVELYRRHLAAGMSKGTFLECDFRVVERCIEHYPNEFPPGTLDRFHKLSLHFWEKLGIAGTAGQVPHFNAYAWAMNMRHRYHWLPKDPVDVIGDKPTVVVLNLGKELKPPPTIEHQPKQPREPQKVISPYDAE